MTEGRKIAVILAADIVGYSRLMGADEEGTLQRLRTLRAELFAPTVEARGGRVVNRAGDGAIVEFKSVVEAVRCALEIGKGLAERNALLPSERRIEVRTGVHLGDVIETADGDLFGDGVNIAARLEGICEPGALYLSEDAWRQVRDKVPETFIDLGEHELKNIARPMRVYALGGTGVRVTPASGATVDAPAHERRVGRGIHAAIGALERVARLTDEYADQAEALREAARRLRRDRGRRRGLAKAAEVVEKVERIVSAVADGADPVSNPARPPSGVDHPAGAPEKVWRDPPAPLLAPGPDSKSSKTAAPDRSSDESRGPGEAGPS